IADDNAPFRSILRLFLERAGDIEIVGEAKDGGEALAAVEAVTPDVLLLDIRMPRMSGIEVLRQLHKKSSPVKVIVLSGHDEEGYRRQALQLGAFRYLLKDHASTTLIDTIRDVVKS